MVMLDMPIGNKSLYNCKWRHSCITKLHKPSHFGWN